LKVVVRVDFLLDVVELNLEEVEEDLWLDVLVDFFRRVELLLVKLPGVVVFP
jgi:hypothetical protein